jgi:hypothetical protein
VPSLCAASTDGGKTFATENAAENGVPAQFRDFAAKASATKM